MKAKISAGALKVCSYHLQAAGLQKQVFPYLVGYSIFPPDEHLIKVNDRPPPPPGISRAEVNKRITNCRRAVEGFWETQRTFHVHGKEHILESSLVQCSGDPSMLWAPRHCTG
jgi:hypothetical protein